MLPRCLAFLMTVTLVDRLRSHSQYGIVERFVLMPPSSELKLSHKVIYSIVQARRRRGRGTEKPLSRFPSVTVTPSPFGAIH